MTLLMRVRSNRRAPFKNEIGALFQRTRKSVRVLSHPLHPNHKLLGFMVFFGSICFFDKYVFIHALFDKDDIIHKGDTQRIISYENISVDILDVIKMHYRIIFHI